MIKVLHTTTLAGTRLVWGVSKQASWGGSWTHDHSVGSAATKRGPHWNQNRWVTQNCIPLNIYSHLTERARPVSPILRGIKYSIFCNTGIRIQATLVAFSEYWYSISLLCTIAPAVYSVQCTYLYWYALKMVYSMVGTTSTSMSTSYWYRYIIDRPQYDTVGSFTGFGGLTDSGPFCTSNNVK